jgi:hypothetical protein
VKKKLISLFIACLCTSMLLWAKQPDPANGVPGEAEADAEAQAREMLQAAANANFPKFVRVQVEFIEMPHETLTRLLYMNKPGSADAALLRDSVQDEVEKGDAAILETVIGSARSGERSLVESVEEIIYPTEFLPSSAPSTANAGSGETEPAAEPAAKARVVAPPTPSAFETRNLGTTLEIEPTIGGNDKIIDLRFSPTLTWHCGESVWMERKDGLGDLARVQTPKFYSLRLTTAQTCLDGQYMMVAAISPKDAAGVTDRSRKVMVFVKCDILVVK